MRLLLVVNLVVMLTPTFANALHKNGELNCGFGPNDLRRIDEPDDRALFDVFFDATTKWAEYDKVAGQSDISKLTKKEKAELMREATSLLHIAVVEARENQNRSWNSMSRKFYQEIYPLYLELYEIYYAGWVLLLAESALDIEFIVALGATFITKEAKYLTKPMVSFADLQIRKRHYQDVSLSRYLHIRTTLVSHIKTYVREYEYMSNRCAAIILG